MGSGLAVLRGYQPAWLPHDLAAGLVLTTMLVPVGIARRGRLRRARHLRPVRHHRPSPRLRPVGPSRILVLGPDSSLAALIFSVVVPLSAGDPARAVALAGAMALVSGLVCILAGLLRLGFITELLSKPIRYGYMNASLRRAHQPAPEALQDLHRIAGTAARSVEHRLPGGRRATHPMTLGSAPRRWS